MTANEFIDKWAYMKYDHGELMFSDKHKLEFNADLISVIEYAVSDEEMLNYAITYVSHKSLKAANRGLIKDAIIIGMKALRSRIIEQLKGK